MTKPKTLREWMSDQQAPAEIQEKMQQLFALPDRMRTTNPRLDLLDILAHDLEFILGKENT